MKNIGKEEVSKLKRKTINIFRGTVLVQRKASLAYLIYRALDYKEIIIAF